MKKCLRVIQQLQILQYIIQQTVVTIRSVKESKHLFRNDFTILSKYNIQYYTTDVQSLNIYLLNQFIHINNEGIQVYDQCERSNSCAFANYQLNIQQKNSIMGNIRITVKLHSNIIYNRYQQNEGNNVSCVLYHGTTSSVTDSIYKSEKLNPSTDGRMGPGIYFTDTPKLAMRIAQYRANQQGNQPALITCKIITKQKYLKQGMHPQWGYIKIPFKQYCLTQGHITITDITVYYSTNSCDYPERKGIKTFISK